MLLAFLFAKNQRSCSALNTISFPFFLIRNDHIHSYLVFGSTATSRGMVSLPVSRSCILSPVAGSMTSISLCSTSDQYSFSLIQSQAIPSVNTMETFLSLLTSVHSYNHVPRSYTFNFVYEIVTVDCETIM